MTFNNRKIEYKRKLVRRNSYDKLLRNNTNKLNILCKLNDDEYNCRQRRVHDIRIVNLEQYIRFLKRKIANIDKQF
jgi:hypothetical protein